MIHVLIPFFNRKQLTLECLESFSKQTYSDYSITLVDDGSTNGSSEAIQSRFPNVEIIKTKGGLWWAESLNVGLKTILPRAGLNGFVLIINQDTAVKEDYLKKMLKASEESGRALVGSTLKSPSGETIKKSTSVDWDRFTFSNSSGKIDLLPTRGILIPVEVFQKIGLFTPLLPHHGADINFSMKAKRAGFNLVLSSEAVVYNKEDAGDKSWSFWYRQFGRRSSSNVGMNIMLALLNAPTLYLKLKCVLIIIWRFFREFFAHAFPK